MFELSPIQSTNIASMELIYVHPEIKSLGKHVACVLRVMGSTQSHLRLYLR